MMGELHCRASRQVIELDLVGVHDPDAARAAEVARRYECVAFASPEELFDAVDAVSIVTPTATHADCAIAALESGQHVLIEKPIADTVAAGERVRAAAERAGRVCLVGHIERYNATFGELQAVLGDERPVAVSA